ncbi:cytochrome c oxidase subunit 3 [bacterium]|nr:cytochrome c oxidase subunit 3 [bacterium]
MARTMAVAAAPGRTARERGAVLPNGVAGMLIFVVAELMFFAGLGTAFAVARAGATMWPPLGQPRLPVEVTALNTLVLLASGACLARAHVASARREASVGRWLTGAMLLGATFVTVQGVEWTRLIRFGLTMTSSSYGAFFYLIVGAHALHALAAILGLAWTRARLAAGTLTPSALWAAEIFWGFVVGVWPFLYVAVYLA